MMRPSWTLAIAFSMAGCWVDTVKEFGRSSSGKRKAGGEVRPHIHEEPAAASDGLQISSQALLRRPTGQAKRPQNVPGNCEAR